MHTDLCVTVCLDWLGAGCYVYFRKQCSAQPTLKAELRVLYTTSAGGKAYSGPAVVWS